MGLGFGGSVNRRIYGLFVSLGWRERMERQLEPKSVF